MTQFRTRALPACAAASLLVAGMPALALAEEENTGMKLLLPNMSEFIPACIAFLIIYLIMAKVAWPPVMKMMQKREDKIQEDLDTAEQAKQEAVANVAASEERIRAAEREAVEIVAKAKRDAEDERSAILAKASADAAATIAKSKDAIEMERKKAMVKLSGSVVDLSIEIASKIIGEELNDEKHRALAERYLAEVGKSDAS